MFSKTAEEVNLIEGDIVIDPKLLKIRSNGMLLRESDGTKDGSGVPKRSRRGLSFTNKLPHEHRWKNGFVPYKLSYELSKSQYLKVWFLLVFF